VASTNPRLYLETSVLSYLTARPSRDLITHAHQQLTVEWWEEKRRSFQMYVSELVIQEAERGDSEAAGRRLKAISDCDVLAVSPEATELAAWLVESLPLPESAGPDALHLALAIVNEMDFLLTWNCRHLASGFVRHRLPVICRDKDLDPPTICTPEELLYGNEDMD
jgi:hypothetical protein